MANIVGELTAPPNLFTVLPSAARTATPDSFEYYIPGRANGLIVVIDATAVTSTPSLTVAIAGVDRISGKTFPILTSAAISTVSTVVLRIGRDLTAAANLTVNDLVPPFIRVTATHGNANSITYSVSGMLCG